MSEKKNETKRIQDLSFSVKQRREKLIMNQRSLGEQNKEKIMQSLAFNHPIGRTTHELKIDTGLDRDTIYTHGENLKKMGLVIKEGKFGKYRLTEKALNDPSIGSWIFRGEVMRGVAKWSVPGSKPNKFCNIDKQICDKEYQTERELFDFANKISALITYILLHALRPRDVSINGASRKKVRLSGKEKTEQAIRWVENTISPARLLFEFSRLRPVKKGLAVHGWVPPALKDQYRTMDIDDPLWTDYELDEENFKKLTTAFANIYPEINEHLEHIRKTLPDKIQKHKESARNI
jgi:DNA-binding transcriptional ArsR family regulator